MSLKIKYDDITYEFAHSHQEAFEMGNLIAAQFNVDTNEFKRDEAILLSKKEEELLINKIKGTKNLSKGEKKACLYSINRFTLYKEK